MTGEVTAFMSAGDDKIRFRFADGQGDGLLDAQQPPRRKASAEDVLGKIDGPVMGRIARHFQHHITIEQFDAVLLIEDACFNHPMILIDAEATQRV
jgi:hypothetical protein